MKLTGLKPGIYELNEENYTVEDGKKHYGLKEMYTIQTLIT